MCLCGVSKGTPLSKHDCLTIFMPMIRACTVPSAYSSAVPRAAALLTPTKAELSAAIDLKLTITTVLCRKDAAEPVNQAQRFQHLIYTSCCNIASQPLSLFSIPPPSLQHLSPQGELSAEHYHDPAVLVKKVVRYSVWVPRKRSLGSPESSMQSALGR